MEFPTALLGVALGVVLLPQLSAAQARGDAPRYSGLLDWGLRLVLLLALPCAVALLVFPSRWWRCCSTTARSARATWRRPCAALMGYGVGLIGLVASRSWRRASMRARTSARRCKIAVVVLLVTQAMNLLFVPWLGHAGLALSIGLGALINAGWLLIGLRRVGAYAPAPGWGGFLARVLLATAALARRAGLGRLAHRLDRPGRRTGAGASAWMAAVLAGAALLYFGAAGAAGHAPAPVHASGLTYTCGVMSSLRFEAPIALDYFATLVADDSQLLAARSGGRDRPGRLSAARRAGRAGADRRAGGDRLKRRLPADAARCSGCAA